MNTKYPVLMSEFPSSAIHRSVASLVGSLTLLACVVSGLAVNQVQAGTVLISNFSSQFISTNGAGWSWYPDDPNAPGSEKNLDLLLPTLNGSYLREGSIGPISIAGATYLKIVASWIPINTSVGTFSVQLQGVGGGNLATASFSLSEFAGGSYVPVVKPLTWINSSPPLEVDQWTLLLDSFSGSGGDLFFQEMLTLDSAAVPEPTSMAIFGLGALGLAFRSKREVKA